MIYRSLKHWEDIFFKSSEGQLIFSRIIQVNSPEVSFLINAVLTLCNYLYIFPIAIM